jgi:hypothetical protein
MRVRLIRKLADKLNGVDVSKRRVGDVIDRPRRDAELLVAEGWARPQLITGMRMSRTKTLNDQRRRRICSARSQLPRTPSAVVPP